MCKEHKIFGCRSPGSPVAEAQSAAENAYVREPLFRRARLARGIVVALSPCFVSIACRELMRGIGESRIVCALTICPGVHSVELDVIMQALWGFEGGVT
ncbi:hypothetical protein NEOLEDRAFT_1143663 [Neolentinus lepideus HHB14362 ss-1]|uniref:Uncharacterized protein n=1 Tax=Neolentinus lepideus HHB14362 ss-1 TaxID=1314782 RepID=A0A165ME99_9AGAM|nr:hypothetical protein NEOLEDRAFT_1143663 [Neolentinus lepideus HHB14362 ss-1]